MVRETRFAFDEDFDDSNPYPTDVFTEEDERFLDAFSPPELKPSSSQPNREPKAPRKKPKQTKRHLADADWIDPQAQQRSRRRKPA